LVTGAASTAPVTITSISAASITLAPHFRSPGQRRRLLSTRQPIPLAAGVGHENISFHPATAREDSHGDHPELGRRRHSSR
jgi:hypothetical protein